MPCVPLMVAFALPLLELTEGARQQPRQRERNHNDGIATPLPWLALFPKSVHGCRNGCRSSDVCPCGSVMSVALIVANVLALVPSDLTEGNEPAATTEGKESTTRESERPCLVAL